MSIKDISIKDYDYPLTEERIAKYPLAKRDCSKLLVYNKGKISETVFSSLPDQLPSNSLIVFNNTKVIQARLHFRKRSGATIEIFCLEPASPKDYAQNLGQTRSCCWFCMVGNLKKWKEETLQLPVKMPSGEEITLNATRKESTGNSHRIFFEWNSNNVTFAELIEAVGELPIPPYLNRKAEESDKQTYQTVYSKIEGSVAAPTAGLHFTPDILTALKGQKITSKELTLHVGAGTFKPVKSEKIEGHDMHTEHLSISLELIDSLLKALEKGEGITAVGTTCVRTLESLYYIGLTLSEHPDWQDEDLHVSQWRPYEYAEQTTLQKKQPLSPEEALEHIRTYMKRSKLDTLHASTQIIIVPGYKFHIVKRIITNFHQPKSTLLLLVSAFVGEDWKKIYDYALKNNFRFLSYGDSSLLAP